MNNLFTCAALVLAAVAVRFDLTTDKVPNRLILIGYAIGLLLRVRDVTTLLQCLGDILLPIVLLYPLFLLRGLGAGDIKLFSVLSVLYPHAVLLQIMIDSVFVGAAIIVVRRIGERRDGRRVHYIHFTICILGACVIAAIRERML